MLLLVTLILAAGGLVASQDTGLLSGIHETRVVESAREMRARGDPVVPYLAGRPRFQKPPLPYYLARLAYQIRGEPLLLGARLGVGLLGLATLLLTYLLGRAFLTPFQAAAGTLVLASSELFLQQFRILTPDAVLCCCTTAAVAAAAWSMRREGPGQRLLLLLTYLASGAALLAKGPVALPFIILGAFSLCPSNHRRLSRLWHLTGLLLALAPLVIWILLVVRARPDAWQVWTAELGAGLGGKHPSGGGRSLLTYLGVLPLFLAPWTPILLFSLWPTSPARGPARRWFLLSALFLALLTRYKAAYLLPACPAAALMVAQAFLGGLEAHQKSARLAARIQLWLLPPTALLLLGLGVGQGLFLDASNWPANITGTLLVTGSLLIVWALLGETWRLGAASALVLALVAGIFFASVLRPARARSAGEHSLGDLIRSTIAPGEALLDPAPPSPKFCFYARRVPEASSNQGAPPGAAWLLGPRASLTSLRNHPRVDFQALLPRQDPRRSRLLLHFKAP